MGAIMPAGNVQTDGFAKLEAMLLALGGETVLAGHEPHLGILLERGRAFEVKGSKRVKGQRYLTFRSFQ